MRKKATLSISKGVRQSKGKEIETSDYPCRVLNI